MTDPNEDLLDSVYEAAIIPELWPDVLAGVANVGGGNQAAILAYDRDFHAKCIGTPGYMGLLDAFAPVAHNYKNLRPIRFQEMGLTGFAHDLELFSQEELDADPLYQDFAYPLGFGHAAGVIVPTPAEDILVFDLMRYRQNGPFSREHMIELDRIRAHLVRAGLLAYKLGLKTARAATEALGLIGLPAAAIAASGRVLSANTEFNGLSDRLQIHAFDQLRIATTGAHQLYRTALTNIASGRHSHVASIPLPATLDQPALVLHLVPIRRLAQDIFQRTALVMVVTPVSQPKAPMADVLTGLFDLSPAENRVARALSVGQTLDEIAATLAIGRETVRTQLKSILTKTGTDRQSDLLLLLDGTRPIQRY